MDLIYVRAEQVLVWQGEDTEAENDAFAAIPSITTNLHNTFDLASSGLPPRSSPLCWSVWRILERSWFTRFRVMREVALARRVVILFGTETIPWETLSTFLVAAGTLQPIPESAYWLRVVWLYSLQQVGSDKIIHSLLL